MIAGWCRSYSIRTRSEVAGIQGVGEEIPPHDAMPYDLKNFELSDMTRCGAALRVAGEQTSSMQEVAEGVVRYLYEYLLDGETRSCVLVRLFLTLPYMELDSNLRAFGDRTR